ncbi:MAG TPA: ThiF family adenylyltransferase [Anaeromyxobacteraceae bacterium]|nr:ThiF family adenylyltransferase [Anaeromyxobacteraceae bacterium]
MFAVGDWVLGDLEREIAAHPPERGGALLGPRLRPVVTRFLPDPAGAGGGGSWAPSRDLDAAVKALEREQGLELKGLAHSHPPGLDRPSEQDARELAEGLRRNGHMPCYLAPVITRGPPGELGPHELALPSGKISCFAAWRAGEGGASVLPLRPRLLPLRRDCSRLARELGAGEPVFLEVDPGAGLAPSAQLRLPGGVELTVVAGEQYPALPPLVLAMAGGAIEQLQISWRLTTPEAERLLEATRAALVPPGPYRRVFGPRGGPALTADPARARLAGWEARLAGEDPEAAAGGLRDALLARGTGILSPSLRDRNVLLAGLGSVGSYMAEQLARSGVGGLALVDPEPVEAANLSRTAYAAEDVGRPKAEALGRRLLAVAPSLRLDLRPARVEDLHPADLDSLVRAADLVVAATDDPAAQRALDRFAYARGRPAVFVGLYAGARGGEVILSVPERTPCYLCATRARHAAERNAGRVQRETDYGTGRLAGESALGADIQHVASAAVKLTLSLLLPGGPLGALAEEAVAEGTPYLTLSTVPRYWFYPEIFRNVPGQGAFQAVWLSPVRAEGCSVCGPAPGRVDPLAVPLREPSREALAALGGGDLAGPGDGLP